MADKFELKKNDNWIDFDTIIDTKKRPSLVEYKEVII
jgi:hypothetical protein